MQNLKTQSTHRCHSLMKRHMYGCVWVGVGGGGCCPFNPWQFDDIYLSFTCNQQPHVSVVCDMFNDVNCYIKIFYKTVWNH